METEFVIKICGITTAEDAQAAVAAGANALGFNFWPESPRAVTPEQAHAIVAATPGSYLRVGVFVHAEEAMLARAARTVPLDILQLHGHVSHLPVIGHCRYWRGIPGETAHFEAEPRVEAYLLDSVSAGHGGSGRAFDWSAAAEFPHRAIVAGGLDASNVALAIEMLRPWGVDACSRLEFRPGRKDPERVRSFIAEARRAALACALTRSADSEKQVSV